MKKKILWILLLIIGSILKVNYVNAENIYPSYSVGDKIEVRVNDQQTLNFYVTASSDSNTLDVNAIYEGRLGEDIYLAEGMKKDECLFEKSNIYTELVNRTSSWTNVKSVTLPTGSEILGQNFDESDITNFKNISIQHGGDRTAFKLDGISTTAFYALNFSSVQYWTSSIAPASSDMEIEDSAKIDSYPCIIYEYGFHLLNSGTYLIASWGSYSGGIRPLITVSKEHIVVPNQTKTTTPAISNRGSQTVRVANTAKGTTILIFVIGLILLGVGIFMIYKAVEKKDGK